MRTGFFYFGHREGFEPRGFISSDQCFVRCRNRRGLGALLEYPIGCVQTRFRVRVGFRNLSISILERIRSPCRLSQKINKRGLGMTFKAITVLPAAHAQPCNKTSARSRALKSVWCAGPKSAVDPKDGSRKKDGWKLPGRLRCRMVSLTPGIGEPPYMLAGCSGCVSWR